MHSRAGTVPALLAAGGDAMAANKSPEAARSGQTKAVSDVSAPSRSVHFFFIEPG